MSERIARLLLGVSVLLAVVNSVAANEEETEGTEKSARFGYMLVIPNTVVSGASQKTCMSLHNVPEGLNVDVTVRLHNSKDTVNYDLVEISMGSEQKKSCFPIKVPEVTGKNRKLAAISVDIVNLAEDLEYGVLRRYNTTEKLMIRPSAFTIFINTDKQIYKPGQLVQFRVLQLHGLFPTNYQISEIVITDPKRRKLMVYNHLAPTKGIVSGEFQLVAEPTLGQWQLKVTCEHRKFETSFRVQEYVLPKYEVKIEVPKLLHVESEDFEIKICGKYTYGKPVRGNVVVKIEVSSSWYHAQSSRPSQVIRTKTDETGCAVVVGSPSTLRFTSRDYGFYGQKLSVTADITEDVTGVKLSGVNKDCEVTTTPYEIKADQNYYFKPGLTWSTEVVYQDIVGSPLPDRVLTVKVLTSRINMNGIEKPFFINKTTDDHGKIVIRLDTSYDVISYSIEAYDPTLSGWDDDWWINDALLTIRRPTWYMRLTRAFSPSFSYLSLDLDSRSFHCNQKQVITGKAIITYPDGDYEEPEISYKITSRNNIVDEGEGSVTSELECTDKQYIVNENETVIYLTCRFDYELSVTPTMEWMPKGKIIAYLVKKDGEVVAEDASAPVNKCFSNEASVQFDSESVRPGENVALTLNAAPQSLCALSIVDKSVHLLGGDNSLTAHKVESELEISAHERSEYVEAKGCEYSHFAYRYTIDSEDFIIDTWVRKKRSAADPSGQLAEEGRREKRSFYRHYGVRRDAYDSFKELSLLYLTNLKINLINCEDLLTPPIAFSLDLNEEGGRMAEDVSMMDISEHPKHSDQDNVIEVRNYFPETWKWELIEIGDYGSATLTNQEMPDTITEWVATAYCVSNASGIGVADTAVIKGFKPVFLSMTLPYSVIRGEEITIKSTLFNYLSKETCLEMVISLQESEDFEILGDSEATSFRCVCGGRAVSISFEIRPLVLGEITFTLKAWSRDGHLCGKDVKAYLTATDGVERKLIVEAEGEEEEATTNDFLCVKDDGTEPATASRSIVVPDNTYEGSARVLVNVIGSIMGPVMDNLDHLIRVPYGCGEQNMVTMVPNIVVLKYLTATGRITEKVQKRIESNILLGYQRQLNYQRRDGSFSAFGESDSSGSTWLTAFVISTFRQVKEYIFVDDEVISKAESFIKQNIGENGCVKKIGLVHNKLMMGGADGENALNAYVALALYRPGDPVEQDDDDVSGCDGSLELKTYTSAIMFYKNALSGKFLAARLLWSLLKLKARLPEESTFEGAETIYWTDTEQEESNEETWYWWHKPSDAVEITGYALLGYLKMEESFPDEFRIEGAFPMVQWLTSQRNAYGGWSSTQNTIIGITALSAYAARTYTKDTALVVRVDAEESDESIAVTVFKVTPENSLVVQQSLLTVLPRQIRYEASGKGCALVQTNLKYNIPRKEVEPSFTLTAFVRGLENGCDAPGTRLLTVCASYQGTREQPVSNMAVIEVKLVSGYQAVTESLKKMTEKNKFNGLKRHEVDGKKVTIYFRSIGSLNKCAAFEVSHDEDVKNPQPGTARVYDYYDTAKESSILYNMSCNSETYIPKEFVHDCRKWGNDGFCKTVCLEADPYDGYCRVTVSQTPTYNYCKMYGTRSCGERGRCILTKTYYRCSCYEGYKESRWGGRCIPEDEDEENVIQEVGETVPDVLELFTDPDCADEMCPNQMPALILPSGNTTEYFCMDGYTLHLNGSKSYCEDINECEESPCKDESLTCENEVGSFSCHCKEGYEPYINLDENIIELSQCTALSKREEEDVKDDDDDEDDDEDDDDEDDDDDDDDEDDDDEGDGLIPPPLVIPQFPPENKTTCPVCLPSFPKPSEYQSVFCPKVNVFVLTNTSSTTTMTIRGIVFHGDATYLNSIKNVDIHKDPSCVCDNLLKHKSMLVTPLDVVTNAEGKAIILDHRSTVTYKRAWKKVQKLSCVKSTPDEYPSIAEPETVPEGAPEGEPETPPMPEYEGVIVPKLASVPDTPAEGPK